MRTKLLFFLLLINVASSKHEYFCDGSERRTSDNAKGYQGVRDLIAQCLSSLLLSLTDHYYRSISFCCNFCGSYSKELCNR